LYKQATINVLMTSRLICMTWEPLIIRHPSNNECRQLHQVTMYMRLNY